MPEGYRVPAVQAAIKVLRALEQRDSAAATQAQLVSDTGIPKSTMHNLLATLVEEGLVRRSGPTGDYRLGAALIHLGAAAARNTRLLSTAIDSVAPLASEHGLSFAVAQPIRAERAQIVERFYPPQDVHVGVTIGAGFGPFDGALGKCLLAAMPPGEARTTVGSRPIPARTKRTITDPTRLLNDIDEVRERGWASSRQEFNENNAVAAMILGPDDAVEAFIVALGFANQLPEADIPAMGNTLRDLARAAGSGRPSTGDGKAGAKPGGSDEAHVTASKDRRETSTSAPS